MAGLLLGGGADMNQAWNGTSYDNGGTPLFIAAQKGYVEVVGLLLNSSTDVGRAKTVDGATPLHVAAQKNMWK